MNTEGTGKVKVARKPIRCYKAFSVGTEGAALLSPQKDFYWGEGFPGRRIMPANGFRGESSICVPGIHAALNVHDAKLAARFNRGLIEIWSMEIPIGARYFISSLQVAEDLFDDTSLEGQVRAEEMIFVKKVLVRGRKSAEDADTGLMGHEKWNKPTTKRRRK